MYFCVTSFSENTPIRGNFPPKYGKKESLDHEKTVKAF